MNKFTSAGNEVEIRGLAPDDWQAVSLIYQEGIATGQATFETQTPSWAVWDQGHLPAPRLVCAAAQRVVAWAAISRVSARAVYAGVAETSVYVGRDWRGKGVGRALLDALVTESEMNGIWTLQASIFPENEASVHLHRSCGFRVVGTRERIAKLHGVWRDTLLLERRSVRLGHD